jgi:hypothetical protein
MPKLKLNLSGKSIKNWKSLIEVKFLLNMSLPLPMEFAAKAHLAEGRLIIMIIIIIITIIQLFVANVVHRQHRNIIKYKKTN